MAKPIRRWRDKFREALRGVVRGVHEHSSFRVHVPVALLVVAFGAWIGCDRLEWCLLVGSIALVLTAELLNSALETLFYALDEPIKERVHGCLDIAAGAVLVAAVGSAIVGGIVFVPKIVALLK